MRLNPKVALALVIGTLTFVPTVALWEVGQAGSSSPHPYWENSEAPFPGIQTCNAPFIPTETNGSQCFRGVLYTYETVGFPNTSTANYTPPGENFVIPRWMWDTEEKVTFQGVGFEFSYSICCNPGLGNGSAALSASVTLEQNVSWPLTLWAEFRSSGWATALTPYSVAGMQWGFGPYVRLMVAEGKGT
jgi:hypothetical protein